jgi:brefeldin A-resistance guanine nucleotide exchange factor 1
MDGYRYVQVVTYVLAASCLRYLQSQIFEMFQTLFLHSLLPPKLTHDVEFLSGNSTIPLKSLNPSAGREERKAEAGLLSTLSSYLLSPYTTSSDVLTVPNEEDIESTLSAIDCVSSCKLEELYGQVQ